MRKPIGAEIRDQVLHALVGMGITLLLLAVAVVFSVTKIMLYAAPLVTFAIALIREWFQHKEVYFPAVNGGSFRDIMFFVVGSLLVVLIFVGVRSWI